MNSFKYALSLRIFSKTIAAGDICDRLNLEPTGIQQMGERRKTITVEMLDGIYERSFCLFCLTPQEGEMLEEMIERTVDNLLPSKNLFQEIRAGGGSSDLYIGWFTNEKNTGASFDCRLLAKLAEVALDLQFDVYGGPDIAD